MPVLLLTCSRDVESAVLEGLAGIVARHLGVPLPRVMAVHVPVLARMGGSSEPVALAEIRSARRLEPGATRDLVTEIVHEIRRTLAIEETRIYVQVEPRDGLALWRSEGGEALDARPAT